MCEICFTNMEPNGTHCSETRPFHFVGVPGHLPMISTFFQQLHNILLHGCTLIYLTVPLLMDIFVSSLGH